MLVGGVVLVGKYCVQRMLINGLYVEGIYILDFRHFLACSSLYRLGQEEFGEIREILSFESVLEIVDKDHQSSGCWSKGISSNSHLVDQT